MRPSRPAFEIPWRGAAAVRWRARCVLPRLRLNVHLLFLIRAARQVKLARNWKTEACHSRQSCDGCVRRHRGAPRGCAGTNRQWQCGLHGCWPRRSSGAEAAWAGEDINVLAPVSLIQLTNHFKGTQVMARPRPAVRGQAAAQPDLRGHRGPGKRQAGARNRPPPAATISCRTDRQERENRCSQPGCHRFCRRSAHASSWRFRSSIPSRAISLMARSPIKGLFERRIIRPRWRRWSAAARGRGQAKSRLPIRESCFSTNCRSSSRRSWIVFASRSKPARSRSRGPTTASSIRRGFSSSRR